MIHVIFITKKEIINSLFLDLIAVIIEIKFDKGARIDTDPTFQKYKLLYIFKNNDRFLYLKICYEYKN